MFVDACSGDQGSGSAAPAGADENATIDVKCGVARDTESSCAATLTSGHGHVTAATEHDHLVSSTMHSDTGQLCSSVLPGVDERCQVFAWRHCTYHQNNRLV